MILDDVIKKPILTEKTSAFKASRVYVFSVDLNSNKFIVAKAVEKYFSVKVQKVRVIRVKPKPKYNRLTKKKLGFKSSYKKAYVTLEKEQEIKEFDA